jgi:hypothetical protein
MSETRTCLLRETLAAAEEVVPTLPENVVRAMQSPAQEGFCDEGCAVRGVDLEGYAFRSDRTNVREEFTRRGAAHCAIGQMLPPDVE